MASAQGYSANLPDVSTPTVGSDFDTGDSIPTGKSLGAKVTRFFGGRDFEQEYQNLLTANNRAYEQGLLREQRAYEEYVRNREYYREDTKMQRMINDLKAAGINPYYALQGGISGSSARGQAANNGNFSRGSSAENSKDNPSGVLAGIIAGVAKIIAAVIGA